MNFRCQFLELFGNLRTRKILLDESLLANYKRRDPLLAVQLFIIYNREKYIYFYILYTHTV